MKIQIRFNRLAVLGMVCAVTMNLMSCKSPDGPTMKEQVNQALALYYQGEKLERDQDFQGAAAKYKASLDISPRPIAYFRLAYVHFQMDQIAEADAYLEEALRLSPNYRWALQLKQQVQVRKNLENPDTAATTPQGIEPTPLEQAAAVIEPGETESPVTVETKQPDPVMVESALEGESKEWDDQAKEAENQGKWAEAATWYRQIVERNPSNAKVFHRYGYILFQQGEYQKSIEMFQKSIELNPKSAAVYNDLGVALEQNSQSAEAEKAYEKSVEIGDHSDAFFNLALMKEKRGEYKKSIDLYEKYLQYDGASAFAAYARERIQILQRKAF